MTKADFEKTLKRHMMYRTQLSVQLKYIQDLVGKIDPWLLTAYQPVLDKLNTLLLVDRFDEDSLQEFKQSLHLADSTIANMPEHGVSDENDIKDEKLFCYLYSIFDTVCYLVDDGVLLSKEEQKVLQESLEKDSEE